MDQFIGQIFALPYTFAPVTTLPCDGRTLPISQYEALYTLLGTTYGGDGVSTFGIPDLRSRTPIHYGQGPGLSNYVLGQKAGVESITMTAAQMPNHTHGTSQLTFNVNNAAGTSANPQSNFMAVAQASIGNAYTTTRPGDNYAQFQYTQPSIAGGSQPMDILNPVQAVPYCIAVEGIFPSQN